MQMDEGMDTGPILLQEMTPIRRDETAGELSERLAVSGARLLARTLKRLAEGDLKPTPQDASQASPAPLLKKEDGKILWERDAVSIYHLIRGTDPWPGAYTFYKGLRWRIWGGRVMEGEQKTQTPGRIVPGQIVKIEEQEIQVAAGSGILAVTELQPENGRRMSTRQYLAGHPVEEGDRLDS